LQRSASARTPLYDHLSDPIELIPGKGDCMKRLVLLVFASLLLAMAGNAANTPLVHAGIAIGRGDNDGPEPMPVPPTD
jgi:hypothetical protein